MKRAVTFVIAIAVGFPAASVAQKTVEQQITEAVSPLSRDHRAHATVMGYLPDSEELQVIREGTGLFICLADQPGSNRFQVSCYHRALEPFMARGRELRASGVGRDEMNAIRTRELAAGDLSISVASLTSYFGRINPETGVPDSVNTLRVLYMPYATVEDTGLPSSGRGGSPWLMAPGTPRAHLMIPGERGRFVPKGDGGDGGSGWNASGFSAAVSGFASA